MKEGGPHKSSWGAEVLSWVPLGSAALSTAVFGLYTWCLAIEVVALEGISQTRFQHFLAGTPNAMGDTLAGFVGSLTLIWVVASVIQQSMELRAQRTEFKEMVNAQDAQVRALEAQTVIFDEENIKRKQDEVTATLDVMLVNLARTCELVNLATQWEFDRHADDYSGIIDEQGNLTSSDTHETLKPFENLPPQNLDERVYSHANACMKSIVALVHEDMHKRCVHKSQRSFFVPILDQVKLILEQKNIANNVQKIRLESLKLDSMVKNIEQMLRMDLWQEERDPLQRAAP